MSGQKHWEQDKDSTIYIGNLDERVTDALVWELFLQAGRILNVHLPKDRVTQSHQGYGFVEFISEEDAEYAARIMSGIRLYGKQIRVNKASADKSKSVDVGAELFVGNLDPMVDERILYETFSRFGPLVSAPKVARDDSNLSKGYGFVSFSNFDASDDAIANMNGQYLMNKEVSVQYAYKKDGKGERHGDQAERMLAAQAKAHGVEPAPATIPTSIAPAAGFGGMGAGVPQGVPLPVAFGAPAPYPNMMTPVQARPPPPGPTLPAPPGGLPARPPPQNAGYGGPPPGQYLPPGFGAQAPPMPAGFQQPPQGYPPLPPGFSAPPPSAGGAPLQMPPGFQNFGIRK